jgi:arylsulfatase A-like enzyme
MWKRYEFNGGTSDPCILAWPSVLGHGGEIRHQYHHAIDIVPTITGGTIKRVAIDVSGQPYLDLERQAAAMLARE